MPIQLTVYPSTKPNYVNSTCHIVLPPLENMHVVSGPLRGAVPILICMNWLNFGPWLVQSNNEHNKIIFLNRRWDSIIDLVADTCDVDHIMIMILTGSKIVTECLSYENLLVLHGEYSTNSVKESFATKHVPTGSLRFLFVLNQT